MRARRSGAAAASSPGAMALPPGGARGSAPLPATSGGSARPAPVPVPAPAPAPRPQHSPDELPPQGQGLLPGARLCRPHGRRAARGPAAERGEGKGGREGAAASRGGRARGEGRSGSGGGRAGTWALPDQSAQGRPGTATRALPDRSAQRRPGAGTRAVPGRSGAGAHPSGSASLTGRGGDRWGQAAAPGALQGRWRLTLKPRTPGLCAARVHPAPRPTHHGLFRIISTAIALFEIQVEEVSFLVENI